MRLLTVASISALVFAGHVIVQAVERESSRSNSLLSHRPRDWDRYSIKDGEFSVLLPVTPAMTTYELRVDPLSKSRVRYIIGAYSEGVVYAIYVVESTQSLDEYIGQSRYSSRNDSKRAIKVGDLSGQEYTFQDADIKRVTQYFNTKRYIYCFIAQGSYLGSPDIGIPKFFESIKFESAATGLALIDGPGDQPVSDAAATIGASDARIVTGKETTHKAMVITKPEPTYTDEARKNQIAGTVVLRSVFTSSGAVTNIRLVSGLPFGLSEKAIAAARQIRFIPAIKDGHFVSMYIQLEYNFNLY
jgi:TonB family protein